MEPTRHLELLTIDADRLAATPVDALAVPVPSVDGWTVEHVIRHTGKVHRWVLGMLDADPHGEVPSAESLPKGPDCLPAYREAADTIIGRLRDLDADQTTLTFTGPQPARFWFRRQAHEVAVHRTDVADAVHAAGGPAPEPIAADGAADGIDEWARFFLAVRWNLRHGEFPAELDGRTLHIHGTDDPAPADGAEWLLSFADGHLDVAATHAKGDVALRGSAQDLFLALWRRRPLSDLDLIGDADLAHQVLDIARF